MEGEKASAEQTQELLMPWPLGPGKVTEIYLPFGLSLSPGLHVTGPAGMKIDHLVQHRYRAMVTRPIKLSGITKKLK